jgi:hypothetical protein
LVLDEFNGDLRRLRGAADGDPETMRGLLRKVPGTGWNGAAEREPPGPTLPPLPSMGDFHGDADSPGTAWHHHDVMAGGAAVTLSDRYWQPGVVGTCVRRCLVAGHIVLKRFPAGGPRGSWPAEEFAAARRSEGVPAEVVMELESDAFLVVVRQRSAPD